MEEIFGEKLTGDEMCTIVERYGQTTCGLGKMTGWLGRMMPCSTSTVSPNTGLSPAGRLSGFS